MKPIILQSNEHENHSYLYFHNRDTKLRPGHVPLDIRRLVYYHCVSVVISIKYFYTRPVSRGRYDVIVSRAVANKAL